jgi:hypothetical protein
MFDDILNQWCSLLSLVAETLLISGSHMVLLPVNVSCRSKLTSIGETHPAVDDWQ